MSENNDYHQARKRPQVDIPQVARSLLVSVTIRAILWLIGHHKDLLRIKDML